MKSGSHSMHHLLTKTPTLLGMANYGSHREHATGQRKPSLDQYDVNSHIRLLEELQGEFNAEQEETV